MRKTKSAALAALAFALFMILAGPAAARDRNNDRIPDRWEKRHHLSLKVKQAKRDQDGDGLRNRGEWKAGLDPRDDDSDNDGTEDGDENAGTIDELRRRHRQADDQAVQRRQRLRARDRRHQGRVRRRRRRQGVRPRR